ncbi:unnamed protein product [Phytomonas sp. EM1]|nr:unnamed protein product [Phytomonas sp. EM1]|eukprot:CCW64932.1 unnamed protein product [Phytomonas sp. isolate EM1]
MTHHLIEHSFFFTTEEREAIYRSNSAVNTRPVSFVTRIFFRLWTYISVKLLNEQIAPNAITMVGLLCCLQAYQLIHTYYRYGEEEERGGMPLRECAVHAVGPGNHNHNCSAYKDFFEANRPVQTATIFAALLLMVSIVCGSLDGVHAKRCRIATSLGDIFARVCSSISRVFIALTVLEVMHVNDIGTKWYVLLTLQLIEFNTVLGRINAENLRKDKVKNWAYVATYCFRDSEISFLMLALMALRWIFPPFASYLHHVNHHYVQWGYCFLLCLSFLNIALLKMCVKHKSSIAICLVARVMPIFYLLPFNEYSILSITGDALVVGLLSTEVYVSHLCRRRMHAAVTLICIGSIFNAVVAVTGTVVYVIGILVDLSYSLNLPIFVPVRNVYIDGVFDLCHAGHKRMMAKALSFGNRLIVGVCGDDECTAYKRRPIMTTEERVNEVKLCKYVSEVIPNVPTTGVTEGMIKFYNIHVVACGEEYNSPDDTYYEVPRRLGILRTLPRTPGISTSLLINRIRLASDAEVVAKDKLSGKSRVGDNE